ncbi:hypothetical protein DPMN_142203 [Dreissena polymorpha]|uniref:G-protein coupled receptors family 1 profile domain-containing protein n=1 Tax=Dreissena polymorpha TaxID=45954 RepID=A0A9D4GAP5_DREPO|nr:hypothetical protein DPMN_142203 [Dreissena polymorpha]
MVCKPLKRITYGQRYATRACIGVSLLAIATQWPSIFIYGTHTFQLPFPRGNDESFFTHLTNSTAFYVNLTNVQYVLQGKTYHVTSYYDDVNKIPNFLFHGFLMVGHVVINITLFVVYTVIGHRLFLSSYISILGNRVQKPGLIKKSIVSALTGTASKGKSASNSILIMRMVTFMMSYLPYLILVMLRYLDEDIPRKLPTNLKIVYHVFLKSYFLNSVSRPFIYIVMYERYRKKLLNLIRSWRRC